MLSEGTEFELSDSSERILRRVSPLSFCLTVKAIPCRSLFLDLSCYHMPRLVKHDGESVDLTGRRVRIGRSFRNDINVKVDGISRMHCELRSVDDGYVIVDLGSSNGTWVNKKKITRYELQDGDRIQIGRLKMKYHVDEEDEDAEVAEAALEAEEEWVDEVEEEEDEEESEAKRKKREFLERERVRRREEEESEEEAEEDDDKGEEEEAETEAQKRKREFLKKSEEEEGEEKEKKEKEKADRPERRASRPKPKPGKRILRRKKKKERPKANIPLVAAAVALGILTAISLGSVLNSIPEAPADPVNNTTIHAYLERAEYLYELGETELATPAHSKLFRFVGKHKATDQDLQVRLATARTRMKELRDEPSKRRFEEKALTALIEAFLTNLRDGRTIRAWTLWEPATLSRRKEFTNHIRWDFRVGLRHSSEAEVSVPVTVKHSKANVGNDGRYDFLVKKIDGEWKISSVTP